MSDEEPPERSSTAELMTSVDMTQRYSDIDLKFVQPIGNCFRGEKCEKFEKREFDGNEVYLLVIMKGHINTTLKHISAALNIPRLFIMIHVTQVAGDILISTKYS